MDDLAAARSLIEKLDTALEMLHGGTERTIEGLDRLISLAGEHMGSDADALLAVLREISGQLSNDRDFIAANRSLIRGYGYGATPGTPD